MAEEGKNTFWVRVGESLSTEPLERRIAGMRVDYEESTAHIEKSLAKLVVETTNKGKTASTNTPVRKINGRG
jgi:hypothetical protein